jgi:hypothetical protein
MLSRNVESPNGPGVATDGARAPAMVVGMAETGMTLGQLTGQQVRMSLAPLPTVTKLVILLTEAGA